MGKKRVFLARGQSINAAFKKGAFERKSNRTVEKEEGEYGEGIKNDGFS